MEGEKSSMADLSCGREKKERRFYEVQFSTGHYFYLLYLQRKICVGELGALFFSFFLQRCQEADAGNDDTHILVVKIGAWIYFLWLANHQCASMFDNDVDPFQAWEHQCGWTELCCLWQMLMQAWCQDEFLENSFAASPHAPSLLDCGNIDRNYLSISEARYHLHMFRRSEIHVNPARDSKFHTQRMRVCRS